MTVSVTFFIGAKDSSLGLYLNQCNTACCVVDPFDVTKYIGALPVFTQDQEARILAYSMNIFKQHLFPSYTFQIESARGERLRKLVKLKKRLRIILDRQLAELENKRRFDEVQLSNAIFNVPVFNKGLQLSKYQGLLKGVSGTVVLSNSQSVLHKIKSGRTKLVVICPLEFVDDCLRAGVIPDIVTTRNPSHFEASQNEKLKEALTVADITSNPKYLETCGSICWVTASSLFSELEIKLSDLRNFCSESEFSIRIALELGLTHLFLEEECLSKYSLKLLERHSVSYKKHGQNISTDQISKAVATLKGVPQSEDKLSVARTLNSLNSKIAKYDHECCELRSILWSSDYASLIKLLNGWIPYNLINLAQKDIEVKVESYQSKIAIAKDSVSKGKVIPEKRESSLKELSKSLFWDVNYEIKALSRSNPTFARKASEHLLDTSPKDNHLQLHLKSRVSAELTVNRNGSHQYKCPDLADIEEKIGMNSDVNLILIPGIMDGELQLLCKKYFSNLPVVTMEPNIAHVGNILKFVPLISLMGQSGIWLHGDVDDLTMAYENVLENEDINPVILDPDPHGLRWDLLLFKGMLPHKTKDSL